MARPKKETTLLDITEAERVVSELEKKQDLKISVLDFMRLNLQKFKNTGLSRQTIYERLTSGGLDLGTFNSFSQRWTRLEKSGLRAAIPREADSPAKAAVVADDRKQRQDPARDTERKMEVKREEKPEENTLAIPKKKSNPALRPIYVDGVEVEIDPETGGKTFKI